MKSTIYGLFETRLQAAAHAVFYGDERGDRRGSRLCKEQSQPGAGSGAFNPGVPPAIRAMLTAQPDFLSYAELVESIVAYDTDRADCIASVMRRQIWQRFPE